MRGTKLIAWRLPPLWNDSKEVPVEPPQGSLVPGTQKCLLLATRDTLAQVAHDVRSGLLETVGVESSLSFADGRCSMAVTLPAATDCDRIAVAIEAENLEAWVGDDGQVNIAIDPWYSTKDVDQTVLCATKVIHVLLGLHAVCEVKPVGFGQKLLSSIADVMNAQKASRGPKE